MLRRRRGVGLLGTMAVGGVAYAAGNSAARGRAAEQDQDAQIADLQNQVAMQQSAPPPPAAQPAAPAPGPTSMEDKLEQLQKLSELRAAGVLTDEDVANQKARILAS